MNIREAKEHISRAITAYRTRDEFGRPVIPQHRQRPIFLVGAPGIGKTAIMEQIASEMGIPLVSYSMTHHTRQSALGLPFIVNEEFGGKEYRVSEYTMSEIIATIYRTMRETGVNEGILFLDEINCVSETLAPAMLQFLQYKVFGQHKVPEGWIVTTAGNPPEYNDSVREFDMATMDRVKRINVESDREVWRSYARDIGVHAAILGYLDIYTEHFERVQKSADSNGIRFVTPRSWVDLSDMLKLYERHEMPVDVALVGQYLQDQAVARQFATYYDLFKKYRSEYQIDRILDGNAPAGLAERARAAKFDERLSLTSLLLDGVIALTRDAMEKVTILKRMQKQLLELRRGTKPGSMNAIRVALESMIDKERESIRKEEAGSMLSAAEGRIRRGMVAVLEDFSRRFGEEPFDKGFELVRADYNAQLKAMRKDAEGKRKQMDNAFAFCEQAFGNGQEMLIFVTELTANSNASLFIATFGCEGYFRHNDKLLFYERQVKVIEQLGELGLDELEKADE